ncbi:hypothetical protein HCH_02259 [Hahella chejuensis KCTC 2396]|uniref:Lipoprotein n=1 Tax=Hahella chejuensis (strain KCTC 2396) TaxID=349521 RepID=Q2SJT9_HAHCH|nr:hypothetical protein [Hahella chejuensis]ABC29085.1 hypothetical protein HCH_02259 [Hahella chejuensis KCTC 2396]
MRYLLLTLLLSLTGCSVEFGPEPVKEGPAGAVWAGGADGGVFVSVKEDSNPNDRIYLGKIYFEHDSSIWYDGRLELVGDIAFDPSDKTQYSGWDGEVLHLKNKGGYLKSLDEPREPTP